MEYCLHLGTLVAIYAVAAMALDLVAGHAGLVCLAHAAFFGLGAYSSAALSLSCGVPVPVGMVVGSVVAGSIGFAFGQGVARLRGDYFVLGTFGLQMVLSTLFNNCDRVTGGPLGLPNIPGLPVPWAGQSSHVVAFGLALLLWAASHVVRTRVGTGAHGRLLHAIREDETLAQSLGKDTSRCRVRLVALSAGMAGAAGSFYAHYLGYIDPSSFSVSESVLLLGMVVIGGPTTRFGPSIGACVLVLLPEGLRFLGFSTATAASLRGLAYGAALVGIALLRPQGLSTPAAGDERS